MAIFPSSGRKEQQQSARLIFDSKDYDLGSLSFYQKVIPAGIRGNTGIDNNTFLKISAKSCKRDFLHKIDRILDSKSMKTHSSIVFLVMSTSFSLATAKRDNISTDRVERSPRQDRRRAIVGGSTADPERFPYYARLEFDGEFGCGGSIIHPEFILTAAHCSYPSDLGILKVIVGGHNYTEGVGIARMATQIIPHLAYDDIISVSNDVALLKIDPIPSDAGIPFLDVVENRNWFDKKEASVTVIGLGLTDPEDEDSSTKSLHEVELKVVGDEQCDVQYSGGIHRKSMLCASDPGQDACQGDSGGPLIVLGDDPSQDLQVGVVSWGEGCGEPGFPGVYADLAYFKPWIDSVICQYSENPPEGCEVTIDTSVQPIYINREEDICRDFSGAFYANWWNQFQRCDWLRESGRITQFCTESNEAWVNCPLTCHSCTYEADDDFVSDIDWTNYDQSSNPTMAIFLFLTSFTLLAISMNRLGCCKCCTDRCRRSREERENKSQRGEEGPRISPSTSQNP